jgi:hypothetical protein
LTIGALSLTPSFDPDVTEYAVTTINASNKVTATTDDPSAVIEIDLDGEPVENGTSPTWASGENTLTITVTDGESETVYTVVVTKNAE